MASPQGSVRRDPLRSGDIYRMKTGTPSKQALLRSRSLMSSPAPRLPSPAVPDAASAQGTSLNRPAPMYASARSSDVHSRFIDLYCNSPEPRFPGVAPTPRVTEGTNNSEYVRTDSSRKRARVESQEQPDSKTRDYEGGQSSSSPQGLEGGDETDKNISSGGETNNNILQNPVQASGSSTRDTAAVVSNEGGLYKWDVVLSPHDVDHSRSRSSVKHKVEAMLTGTKEGGEQLESVPIAKRISGSSVATTDGKVWTLVGPCDPKSLASKVFVNGLPRCYKADVAAAIAEAAEEESSDSGETHSKPESNPSSKMSVGKKKSNELVVQAASGAGHHEAAHGPATRGKSRKRVPTKSMTDDDETHTDIEEKGEKTVTGKKRKIDVSKVSSSKVPEKKSTQKKVVQRKKQSNIESSEDESPVEKEPAKEKAPKKVQIAKQKSKAAPARKSVKLETSKTPNIVDGTPLAKLAAGSLTTTRSGRRSVPVLDWWRNQRITPSIVDNREDEDEPSVSNEWTAAQERTLRSVQLQEDPADPLYWQKVAVHVKGKDASECQEHWFRHMVGDEKSKRGKRKAASATPAAAKPKPKSTEVKGAQQDPLPDGHNAGGDLFDESAVKQHRGRVAKATAAGIEGLDVSAVKTQASNTGDMRKPLQRGSGLAASYVTAVSKSLRQPAKKSKTKAKAGNTKPTTNTGKQNPATTKATEKSKSGYQVKGSVSAAGAVCVQKDNNDEQTDSESEVHRERADSADSFDDISD